MKRMKKNSGFTLVELAIVLVIIGLIIGGVLTGADLIKAATIRSSVSEIEKFNAGATTFRGKYSGLPGDLIAARAVEFNLSAAADANSVGTVGLRDGNSVIEGGSAASTALAGETALFWKDMGAAGLIAGNYPGIGTAVGPAAAVTAANVISYLPPSKLRDSASYYVYSLTGRNYIYMGTITATITAGVVTATNAVTPLEAKGIDEKVDDGAPTTGTVLSMTNLTTANAGLAVGVGVCNSNATPSVYNVSSASTGAAGNVVCQLQIRTSF